MAEQRLNLHPKQHHPKSVVLTETHWGYSVRPRRTGLSAPTTIEAGLRFLGLILVMSAYAQWLVPSSFFPIDAHTAKTVLAGVLGIGGVLIYLLANRGFEREAQVSVAGKEIRFARRNGRNQSKVTRRIAFDRIASAYVRRIDPVTADLFVRLVGGEEVRIVSGMEREMNLLHARFCHDLKSPQERVEMRLSTTKTAPQRVVQLRTARQA